MVMEKQLHHGQRNRRKEECRENGNKKREMSSLRVDDAHVTKSGEREGMKENVVIQRE